MQNTDYVAKFGAITIFGFSVDSYLKPPLWIFVPLLSLSQAKLRSPTPFVTKYRFLFTHSSEAVLKSLEKFVKHNPGEGQLDHSLGCVSQIFLVDVPDA